MRKLPPKLTWHLAWTRGNSAVNLLAAWAAKCFSECSLNQAELCEASLVYAFVAAGNPAPRTQHIFRLLSLYNALTS